MYNYNQINPYQIPKQCVVPEVNGYKGAELYSLGANSSVLLLDSNSPIVYLKQTDSAACANITAFDLVEHKTAEQKEYENINARLSRLEKMLNEQFTAKQPTTSQQPDEQSANSTGNATLQNAKSNTTAVSQSSSSGKRT